MKQEVKVISLDCWNTIFSDNDEWYVDTFELIYSSLRLKEKGIRKLEFWNYMYDEQAVFTESVHTNHITLTSTERLWKLCRNFDLRNIPNYSILECSSSIDKLLISSPPEPINEVLDFFSSSTRIADVRLCLTCNTGWFSNSAIMQNVLSLGLSEYLHGYFFSDVMNMSKPSREVFGFIARYFNVNKNAVLHVGDDFVTDYNGAKKAGCQTLLIKSNSNQKHSINTIQSLNEIYNYLDLD